MATAPAPAPAPALLGPDHPLLHHFSPSWLNRHGFINIDTRRVESDFYMDSTTKHTAKWQSTQSLPHTRSKLLDAGSIHPVLRKSNWQNITNAEWAAIRPAVLLASRWLDEPESLSFYQGVIDYHRHRTIRARKARASAGLGPNEHLYKFRKRPRVTAAAHLRTWRKLWTLKRSITWQAGGIASPDIYACTLPDPSKQGLETNTTRGAIVRINQVYFDVLTDRTTARDIGQRYINWNPGPTVDSAKLRTKFLLAVTICHEFCHALHYCSHPVRADGTLSKVAKQDPFYLDQRLAEVGNAWETTVFRGLIKGLGADGHPSLPFGVALSPWPGIKRGTPPHNVGGTLLMAIAERQSPAKYGVRWASHYAVPMRHIRRHFTKRFWNVNMLRYGMDICKPKKEIGVRNWPNLQLDCDEDATPLVRYLSDSGSDTDADDINTGRIQAEDFEEGTDYSDDEDADPNFVP